MFLYVFSPPEHESEHYFSEKVSVRALSFLSTLPVPHCMLSTGLVGMGSEFSFS